MKQISLQELEEMIKSKFAEKGITSEELDSNILENIKNKIKEEVNKGIDKNTDNSNEEEVVNVDISSQNIPKDEPGEEPEAITTSTVSAAPDTEEVYKKEGELEEKERALKEKEEELKRKEEELRRKEEEMEYEPTIPEKIQNMGAEKLFVFDENNLSVGAEKLSNTDMNLVEDPENKTNMKELWIKEGKKDAEVFVVKFEKIGRIEFDPFEGVSEFINMSDSELPQGPSTTDDYNETNTDLYGNMKDSVNPIKDVTRPMSNDMGLNINKGEYKNIESGASIANIPEQDFEELLNSKLKEIIRDYLNGQIVLGHKKND